jgi:hypothetical protein
MTDGANPGPPYLIVHVDCHRRRAKEKVTDIYVGDVGSQDGRRQHKGASGEVNGNPLEQSGYWSQTRCVHDVCLFGYGFQM